MSDSGSLELKCRKCGRTLMRFKCSGENKVGYIHSCGKCEKVWPPTKEEPDDKANRIA